MVSWFEIPVNDMNRAKQFYETVFEIEIKVQDFGDTLMGWFPDSDGIFGATGSLVKQESYVPSEKGTLVYFMSKDVQIELDRVEAAGGKIFQAKTKISDDHGCMGVFTDSEGNRVAVHSNV
jgi:predicted enzyme related to lactoylglutathione lyase